MKLGITPDAFASRPSPGEVVLLNGRTGEYFSLDGVGAYAWTMLEEGPKTLQELIEAVSASYAVGAERCRGDLERFAVELEAAGLVVPLPD